MIVKKMPILQGFPDFETVNFFTGKFFQKYNFTPVFYDIETTGLSRNSTYLYLIGAVGIEDETWNFYQWMAENANEEETILRIFSQFLQQCDLLISYNGDRFDQPYLEARYEKYGIPSPFTGKQSLDLYLTLKPLKSLLKLSAMKQPCMEEAFPGPRCFVSSWFLFLLRCKSSAKRPPDVCGSALSSQYNRSPLRRQPPAPSAVPNAKFFLPPKF